MAAFDYEDIRDDIATPAIAEFGQAATLTQPGTPTGPDYDPIPGVPTEYPVKVMTTKFSLTDRSGTLVQEDDLKFLMSAEGNPLPDLKGTLTIGVTTYQVYKIDPLSPGATVVLWYVYCRK